jgi:methanogenic corrinoid protein MtbC1
MNEPDKRMRLINHLTELEENEVLALVQERMQAGDDPLAILEDAQEGMRLVGVRYEQGEYFTSGLMMAGEIFREVMELVEPVLVQRLQGNEFGHILVGTVQGDIHDIGKNMFSTMLRANGFTVTDLGVDVPPHHFTEQALQIRPDIIGMSGLLTLSYEVMKATVQQVRQLSDIRIAKTPFIIGGGTINAMVCAFVGAEYWATDAMVGVQLCKQIIAERNAPGAR